MSLFVRQPNQGPTYDPSAVQWMRDELTQVGLTELLTPEDADKAIDADGTCLVVINSVCGCAAGNARPGVMLALQNAKIPDRITTGFAGQEKAAVQRAREKMEGYQPSSPCIALFKDGKVVHILQRMDIETRTAEQVAGALVQGFDEHCTKAGPSIPKEDYEAIVTKQACGRSIPFAQ